MCQQSLCERVHKNAAQFLHANPSHTISTQNPTPTPSPTLPHDVSLCGKIYGRDLKFTIAFNLGFEEPLGHPPPPQLSQDEVVCPFLLTDISPGIVALAGEMK